MDLNRRLARLILTRETFNADDLTEDGNLAVDEEHSPNGKQSKIGTTFRHAQMNGWIEGTGEFVTSKSKYRHSGRIQNWRRLPKGIEWAKWYYDQRNTLGL